MLNEVEHRDELREDDPLGRWIPLRQHLLSDLGFRAYGSGLRDLGFRSICDKGLEVQALEFRVLEHVVWGSGVHALEAWDPSSPKPRARRLNGT